MARPPRQPQQPRPPRRAADRSTDPAPRAEPDEPADLDGPIEAVEFDSGVDERMEALATQGRWPLRLAASALLRVDARTDRLRHRRSGPELRDESVGALPEDAPAPPAKPVATDKATEANKAATKKAAASTAKAQPPPKPPLAAKAAPAGRRADPTAEKLQRARRQHQAKLAQDHDGDRAALDEEAWESWAGGAEQNGHPDGIAELDMGRRRAGRATPKPPREGTGLRKRLSGALDRWAAKETDTWTKAEHRVFHDRKEP